jgi:hypothetical protein
VPLEAPRAGAAVVAGAVAAWSAAELPFFPHGWPVALGLLAASVTVVRARLGAAVALAVPVLPLGNLSLGLAVLYAFLAAALLVVSWREPRGALLFALGPLLVPLGLAPLATAGLRAPARRATQAALAVVVAGIVAGVRGTALPLTGHAPPLGIGVSGSGDPFDVAGSLARALLAQPALVVEAVVFAVVAVALPYARGRWRAAGLGAGFLAAGVLAAPSVTAWPLVVGAWLTAAALAWASERVE